MELKGEIADIIYKNDTNSYTIATFETEDEYTTVVGYLPFINSGDTIKAIGEFVEHKDYGRQFKIETFEKLMPETAEALEKYLATGKIKGVGEKMAERIVKTFGDDTINILRFEYEKLAQIKGISLKKAEEISNSFAENWEVWQIVGFLSRFGIGAEHAKKVYDTYGINAVREIEENPYLLLEITRNVDFQQIDKMALKLGIKYNDIKRIKCGIKYGILKATYNGHCCCLMENLTEFVVDILDVSTEEVEDAIIELKVKDEIIIEKRKKQKWIYLSNFYQAEENVANRIYELDRDKNKKKISNIEKELKIIEKNSDITLSEKQKEAVKSINDHNVTIITGGPGTGKTTIIKTIIELYAKRKDKIVLCAPTGRAAKKMTETTGFEALTLHRLLEIGKIDDDNMYFFNKKGEYSGAPIDADIIVVDELSMVDIFLMSYLLGCIYQGTKLVLVGDCDQLASVGPGNVLEDLIESEKITTIKLDKIFRQAAKSTIVQNAHRVNKGNNFLSKEDIEDEMQKDFFYIKETNQEKILNTVISLCTGRLKEYGNYDFFKSIQVMSPTKKGALGTRELNVKLQEALNPQNKKRTERKRGSSIFRVGDRVMQIKNNYDIIWEKNDIYVDNEVGKEISHGIFNGEMGTIKEIDLQEDSILVEFDDKKMAWYESSEFEELEHSYAITIHKAQGSEFDVVIMVAPATAPMLLTRNLLYTGITRAKQLLIIIGSDRVISHMINNIDSKKRNSGLKYKLKQMGD